MGPDRLKMWRRRLAMAVMVLGLGTGAVLAVSGMWARIQRSDTIVGRFLNLRLYREPVSGLLVVPAALIYPAIGPVPRVAGAVQSERLTYEPIRFHGYGAIAAVGVVAWSGLLAAAFIRLRVDRRLRAVLFVPVAWIALNILFHAVWGDELFLYTPHWAWALMAIVMEGAFTKNDRIIAVACAAIVPAQIVTLRSIFELLPR